MQAANHGAKVAGGLTVGILPSAYLVGLSEYVDIPIVTGLGNARNNVNVLSSRVVIACGMGAGTASEVALAIKSNIPVVLLRCSQVGQAFFQSLRGDRILIAESPTHAIQLVIQQLDNS
ncbi:cytochrome [Leptolyngbya sp. AN02str]|uniref:SLOG cluster 4 domain-containing protein n=1 Tax=Leptolyngbya sp. AN02str TaxID=3423363 RepID=UPI003D31E912